MTRWLKHLLLGVFIGLLGVIVHLSPAGLWLEEKFGLYWLFHLRGAMTAPDNVMVVAIDQPSAAQLGLPMTPRLWPRDLHAQLIEQLTQSGARIIVFDLIFDTPGMEAAHDVRLASSMRTAGNVVLVERLVYEDTALHTDATGQRNNRIIKEGPIQLLPIIADAIKARAPFPLPKTERVNDYWIFKADAGDIPTIPAVVLQTYALPVYDDFIRLLHTVNPAYTADLPTGEEALDIEDLIFTLRSLFIKQPQIVQNLQTELNRDVSLDSTKKHIIQALLNLYSGSDTRYLNFYGPPRSVKTIPYHQVLQRNENAITEKQSEEWPDFKDKIVFVGFSAATQPEQDIVRDDYHTVFSNSDGLYISGVEIAATAFANLLENKPIRSFPLTGSAGVLFLLGLGLGIIFMILPNQTAAIASIILLFFYTGSTYYYFKETSIWLPLVNPLFLQLPVALFGAVILKYYEAKHERQQLKEAFGYFLPERVVNDIAKNAGVMAFNNQLVYGACLATDAEKYTALAEKLEPRQLGQLMNEYYAVLFEPVRQHNGTVSDVVGDAMLAIWAKTSATADLRKEACQACLDIAEAVERFNRTGNQPELPTRMGLHFGEMLLGNIGALQHYEYRAVGDIVNTTNRIQGVNKYLGTRLLVSSEVVIGLNEFLIRPLGDFLLVGKSSPVSLSELVARKQSASQQQLWLCNVFARALHAYKNQQWIEACNGFSEILNIIPEDGPAHYFLKICQQNKLFPPSDSWDPTIRIENK
ncbi:adenylate/guanylate cyclase with Chase sensor [Nitrosomonas sp. Is79A3]|uniref:CHASE2 domain-containing protein n=1 Tax=Nitrosomonas sp. (strain Is79A3) TaxID=261292 RepID=UPI000215D171